MTPAIVLAAVVTLSLALGSLIMQVDGAKLRRWRLSRRWDVSRLAREFIAAADEPLATVRGLKHMIYAWERGDRKPSERYWLLYLRVFPECASAEAAVGGPEEPEDHPGPAEVGATQTAASSVRGRAPTRRTSARWPRPCGPWSSGSPDSPGAWTSCPATSTCATLVPSSEPRQGDSVTGLATLRTSLEQCYDAIESLAGRLDATGGARGPCARTGTCAP